ncbi:MAG: ribbon-helix-helix domain-containing protein [Planctomycetia bacterium]|nr:ribbon-helix-helix domain-containing protein [Planctomycetia bacterium]
MDTKKRDDLLTVSMPPKMKATLKKIFEKQGGKNRTFSRFIRRILRGYIRQKTAK